MDDLVRCTSLPLRPPSVPSNPTPIHRSLPLAFLFRSLPPPPPTLTYFHIFTLLRLILFWIPTPARPLLPFSASPFTPPTFQIEPLRSTRTLTYSFRASLLISWAAAPCSPERRKYLRSREPVQGLSRWGARSGRKRRGIRQFVNGSGCDISRGGYLRVLEDSYRWIPMEVEEVRISWDGPKPLGTVINRNGLKPTPIPTLMTLYNIGRIQRLSRQCLIEDCYPPLFDSALLFGTSCVVIRILEKDLYSLTLCERDRLLLL